MPEYLKHKCETNYGNMFWNIVIPLISDKVKGGQEIIVLSDSEHILNTPQEVSNVLMHVLKIQQQVLVIVQDLVMYTVSSEWVLSKV